MTAVPRMSTKVSAEPNSCNTVSVGVCPCTLDSALSKVSTTPRANFLPHPERPSFKDVFSIVLLIKPPFRPEPLSGVSTLTRFASTSPRSTFWKWTSTFSLPGRESPTTLATFFRPAGLAPSAMSAPRYLSPETPEAPPSATTTSLWDGSFFILAQPAQKVPAWRLLISYYWARCTVDLEDCRRI